MIKLVGKASKAAKKTVVPGSRKRPNTVKKIKTPIDAQKTSKGLEAFSALVEIIMF